MADQDLKKLLESAKCAEQAERYDDMAEHMEKITRAKGKDGLDNTERNLLSVAFKNVVGSRRSSWRVISSLEQKTDNDEGKKRLIEDYRKKIEEELTKICNQVLVSHVAVLLIMYGPHHVSYYLTHSGANYVVALSETAQFLCNSSFFFSISKYKHLLYF